MHISFGMLSLLGVPEPNRLREILNISVRKIHSMCCSDHCILRERIEFFFLISLVYLLSAISISDANTDQ